LFRRVGNFLGWAQKSKFVNENHTKNNSYYDAVSWKQRFLAVGQRVRAQGNNMSNIHVWLSAGLVKGA